MQDFQQATGDHLVSAQVGVDRVAAEQPDVGQPSRPITVNQFCFPAAKGGIDIDDGEVSPGADPHQRMIDRRNPSKG